MQTDFCQLDFSCGQFRLVRCLVISGRNPISFCENKYFFLIVTKAYKFEADRIECYLLTVNVNYRKKIFFLRLT